MKLTWFGHSAFRIELDGAVVLIDPFFTGNPTCPVPAAEAGAGATHILISHGHDDHLGDSVALAKASGAQIVSNWEICMWAQAQGVTNFNPMNSGGTVDCGAFTVSLTVAHHSSASTAGGQPAIYLGNPHGIIVAPKNGKTIYFTGDTDVFSDMALIQELHEPKVCILPVGDRFTMSAKTAALALKRFLKVETAIPCHYGTFPVLAPNADGFLAAMAGASTKVVVPKAGAAFEV